MIALKKRKNKMTDSELKALVAGLAISQKETDKQIQAVSKETDRQIQAVSEEQKKTSKLIQSISEERKELTQQIQSFNEERKASSKQVDKQLKELGKQIGGLGRKFGSFTEGLALPSMQKILREQFKMEFISPSVRVKKQGQEMEIDVLAYSNSSINEVYIVEVKSHLREEGIEQLSEMVRNFRLFFPEHQDKKLFAILAAVDMSERLKKRVLDLGFYAAKIKDDTFSLDVPTHFKAKNY
jgi:septal ring factor EnvC (AmiA/AmiB activator)